MPCALDTSFRWFEGTELLTVWPCLGCRLVDEITCMKAAEAADVATQSAILGPFFRKDHPVRQKGDHITFDTPEDAEVSGFIP
jgi:hypothetical protein